MNGAPDRVLDHPERLVARAAGYVDYRRALGWPDHCRPKGADDFVCN